MVLIAAVILWFDVSALSTYPLTAYFMYSLSPQKRRKSRGIYF
jgi:hypothetical protein